MLNKALLLVLLMVLGFWGCGKSSFPTKDEVDNLIEKYSIESDKSRRVDLLKTLLRRLSNPQSVADDNELRRSLERLAQEYRKGHDEAILIAVDETAIDGGFANFVCEFYHSLKVEKQFKERYLEAPEALQRCVGIAFTQDEIKNL